MVEASTSDGEPRPNLPITLAGPPLPNISKDMDHSARIQAISDLGSYLVGQGGTLSMGGPLDLHAAYPSASIVQRINDLITATNTLKSTSLPTYLSLDYGAIPAVLLKIAITLGEVPPV